MVCTRCILGTSDDPSITFNSDGVCSYCQQYDAHKSEFVKTDNKQELDALVSKIKEAGKGQPYDCVIGLSGGVDSTYLAVLAKKLGLRPLAFHFDNGWNSELAVANIANIVTKLGFDLETHVIDWEEFRDLQRAFLKASVVDIEMLTDHAIVASVYRGAIKHGIKYVLSGMNYVTESVLPQSWVHPKGDHVHIRAISKKYGSLPLKKFPLLSSKLNLQVAWRGITSVPLLNYVPYIKADVKKVIASEVGWRDYGGKHYESVFTRFYQGYILPQKFHIDKRKAHLSNLICSGQITRDEALQELSHVAYPDELFRIDYDFVLKKLGFTKEEFDEIMKSPVKKHSDYPVGGDLYERFPVLRILRPLWYFIKRVKRAL